MPTASASCEPRPASRVLILESTGHWASWLYDTWQLDGPRIHELRSIAGKQAQVGWGSQIRSYVMQPYQMVKDLRTDHEVGNPTAVLDGDLDGFIEAGIKWRKSQN